MKIDSIFFFNYPTQIIGINNVLTTFDAATVAQL